MKSGITIWRIAPVIFIILISISLITLYFFSTGHNYLRFSDGAKFADIARNIVENNGYKSSFSFYNPIAVSLPSQELFSAQNVPPILPYSIAAMFMLFGVSDLAVIATTSLYYILTILLSYLIGKKLFGHFAGIVASMTLAFNLNLLDYSTSGASEIVLMFLLLLATYLLLLQKRRYTLTAFVVFFLMYLTRPQAIIFIFGLVIFLLLQRFTLKRTAIYIVVSGIALFVFDRLLIYPLSNRFGFMPLLERGFQAIEAQAFNVSPSDALRGAAESSAGGIFELFKKVFYNTYNFYRRIPDILSPYLLFTFALGFFIKEKSKLVRDIRWVTLFVVIASVLAAALTIPFYRYLHPVVPLIYILGVGTLMRVFGQKTIATFVIISIFVLGPTLGVLVIDNRFNSDRYNFDKPPAYVSLGKELKLYTEPDDVILTNLDTWGTWYGERKTVWLPISTEPIVTNADKLNVDIIFLTDYLADDENYLVSGEWRKILQNPSYITESPLKELFEYVDDFVINGENTFENKPVKGIILKRIR